MIYYLLGIFMIPFFVERMIVRSSRSHDLIVSFLFLGFLILLASFRYGVGTDFFTYEQIWRSTSPLSESIREGFKYSYLEPGFVLIVAILKSFTDNSLVFFSFFAFVAIVIFGKGIAARKDLYPSVACFYFFCVFYMPYIFNGLRQAVAMSILVFCLPYFKKNNFTAVFILSLTAALIHSTGWLIIIAFYAYKSNIRVIHFLLIGLLASFFFIEFSVLQNIFGFLFPGKVDTYFVNFSEPTSLGQVAFRLALLFIFVSYTFLYESPNREYEKLLKVYMLGFFLYLCFQDFNMLATRFNMFFRVLECILFSMLFFSSRPGSSRVATGLVILIVTLASLNENVSNPDNDYSVIDF